jgi:alpha-tubulin suppressor-like RCC1 family protein
VSRSGRIGWLVVVGAVGASLWLFASSGLAAGGRVRVSGALPSAVLKGARVRISARIIGSAKTAELQQRSGRAWRSVSRVRITRPMRGSLTLIWRAPRRPKPVVLRLAAFRGSRVVATGASQRVSVSAGKFSRGKITVVGKPSAVVSLPEPGAEGTVVLRGVRGLAGAERGTQAHTASQGLLVIGKLTIQPGQVLALGYAANTPEGFLGSVDAITLLQGGQASLQTEPATLQEAGAQGNLDLSRFSQVGPAGSADRRAHSRAVAASVGSSAFNPGVSKAFKCKDGASASLSGNVSVGVTPALHASFSLIHGLTSASFSLTGSARASLTAQANASAGCTLSSTALLKDPLHIATFVGDIGPIPVVVVLQGQVFVDANISGKASVQSDIHASTSVTGGIQWKKGAPNGGFSPIFNGPNASFQFNPPSVSAAGTADADVEPALQMLLYGVAGPQLGVKAGLAFNADTMKNPWWKLTAPVSLEASLTAPDLDLSSGTLTLYQHTFNIADSGGPFNPSATVTVTSPGSQTSTAGTPASLQIQATDSDHGALSYTSTGLPSGLSINQSTGLISGTPPSAGTANVTITATDASGPSGSASFTWTINAPPVTATTAPLISAGEADSCAISSGKVYCWGVNTDGDIGYTPTAGPQSCSTNNQGTQPCSTTPAQVGSIANAIQVAAGGQMSCTLLQGGQVDCWGATSEGQLGNGTTTGPDCSGGCSAEPVSVSGLTTATQISLGAYHSCATTSSGTVDCWGANDLGQLGDGTNSGPETCAGPTACSTAPVQVSAITTATQVSAGGNHTCALLSSGQVDCWGDNSNGDLGNGTTTNSSVPVAVSGITNAIQIAAGDSYSCALLSTGAIDCWGDNSTGELGTGSATGPTNCTPQTVPCSKIPVQVTGITNATQLAAGTGYICSRLASGNVDCWGDNAFGELGDGTASGPDECYPGSQPCSTSPVQISGLSGVTEIASAGTDYSAASSNHSCAVLQSGARECWGDNSWGELGNGTQTSSSTPVPVNSF